MFYINNKHTEFNMVFDNWDGNEPIKNLSYLDDIAGKDTVTHPYFIYELEIPNWKINQCKLTDITTDKDFYYVISHVYSYFLFIKNGVVQLPADVQYHITNTNLKVIFFSSHESPDELDIFTDVLIKTIKKNNWKESNFYIINNNSMLNNIKDKFNTDINFFKMNSLLNLVSNKLKVKSKQSDIVYDKKFIFLCQIKQPHFHRAVLLTYLKNLGLLNKEIIDWSLTVPYTEYMGPFSKNSILNNLQMKHKNYIDITDKNLVSDYLEILNTKKLGYYEQNVDWFNNIGNYIQKEHLTLEAFQNSYINIVAETYFKNKENNLHITEKSFKPFYYFQMPIFLAQYNHVKMIREEYDFNLFDDLIDHSYDNEKDDVKRLKMLVKEIERLSSMHDTISKYYKNNINKILHNHYFVKTYPNKKINENYFLKLSN
jgi:hypothetical protein